MILDGMEPPRCEPLVLSGAEGSFPGLLLSARIWAQAVAISFPDRNVNSSMALRWTLNGEICIEICWLTIN